MPRVFVTATFVFFAYCQSLRTFWGNGAWIVGDREHEPNIQSRTHRISRCPCKGRPALSRDRSRTWADSGTWSVEVTVTTTFSSPWHRSHCEPLFDMCRNGGDTVCDPFNGTVVQFRLAVTALLVVHVTVELPLDALTVGFALIPAARVRARTGEDNNPFRHTSTSKL